MVPRIPAQLRWGKERRCQHVRPHSCCIPRRIIPFILTVWKTVASDISARTGQTVTYVTGDLTNPVAVAAAVDVIKKRHGYGTMLKCDGIFMCRVAACRRIDALVCCAGGNIGRSGILGANAGKPERDDALTASCEDFGAVMDVNLMTAVHCCQVGSICPQTRHVSVTVSVCVLLSGCCP
jgi:NAD(P)-dependent dehydrogenase (short-subunit alcohol dehydrogenase family)